MIVTDTRSYFSVIKHNDQKQLIEGKASFTLAYGPRGMRVHYGEEAWQEVAKLEKQKPESLLLRYLIFI